MANDYLKELLSNYRKGKELDTMDSEQKGDPFAADPYRGLVDDSEFSMVPEPIIEQSPIVEPTPVVEPTREELIQKELEDVKLQQKEHKLLNEKSKLAKAKINNDANEFNEYSVNKELETPEIPSYEKDEIVKPSPLDEIKNEAIKREVASSPATDVYTSTLEQKAGDEVKTREDGEKSQQELIMEQYREAKKQADEKAQQAKYIDAAANLGRGLTQYGSRMAAAEATSKGARVSGELGYQPIDTSSKVQMENAKNLKGLEDQIAALKVPPKTQIVQLGGQVKLINSRTGEEIKNLGDIKKQEDRDKPIKIGKSLVVKQPDGSYKKVFTETESETGKDDPTSNTSMRLKKSMADMGYEISPGMTYNEIMKLGNGLVRSTTKRESNDIRNKSLAVSVEKMDNTQKERAKKWAEKHEDDIGKAQEQVMKTDQYKYAQGILNEVDSVDKIMEAAMRGDETALSTLGVKLAKAFGEKGALSESDVTRYTDSSSLMGLVKSKGARWSGGKLSLDAAKSIKNILTDMRVHAKGKVDEAVRVGSNNLSKKEGINLKEAMYLVDNRIASLNIPVTEPGKQLSPVQTIKVKRLSDGKTITMDAEKAKKYLANPKFERVE